MYPITNLVLFSRVVFNFCFEINASTEIVVVYGYTYGST